MNDTQKKKQLQALRDFFIAHNDAQLADAYTALNAAVSFDMPEVSNWEQVEFSFNRLFIGPKPPTAPLFASVYLEAEPQVMGESTLVVRRIFEMLGVQSPLQGQVPDDHLSMELDACLRISALRQATENPELEDLWSYFLEEHLGQWLPTWLRRIRTADAVHPAIYSVIDILEAWVANDIQALQSNDWPQA